MYKKKRNMLSSLILRDAQPTGEDHAEWTVAIQHEFMCSNGERTKSWGTRDSLFLGVLGKTS